MDDFKRQNKKIAFSLPVKQELKIIDKILHAHPAKIKIGLDAGFRNPFISARFRNNCKYWITVESSARCITADYCILDESTVFPLMPDGSFPFEDRQFDCVVLSCDFLQGCRNFDHTVHECHRVLNTGGILIFTIERKKRAAEKEALDLLKHGFDVLGMHYSCRFWTSMVRHLPSNDARRNGEAGGFKRLLYSIAAALDALLFLARGKRITIHARRKSWRENNSRIIRRSTVVSDAMLFNTKSGPGPFASGRIR